MKQMITFEQLQELTEEQKQKLREQWKPESGDMFTDNMKFEYVSYGINKYGEIIIDGEECDTYNKDDCLPLLSIGQMIELLVNTGIKHHDCGWISAWNVDIDFEGKELCDALWQAVKAVL
jgi:hypothetical protein